MKELKHQFSFLGHFPSSQKYADLRLTTVEEAARGEKKRVVLAHKVVLAAVSDKLEAWIDDKWRDKDCVEVRNIKFETLDKVVKFIYTGSVSVGDSDEEEDFMDGLDMFRIKMEVVIESNALARSPLACEEELSIASGDNDVTEDTTVDDSW